MVLMIICSVREGTNNRYSSSIIVILILLTLGLSCSSKKCSDYSTGELIEMLSGNSVNGRSMAAYCLGTHGPSAKGAIPHLINAIQDKSASVRKNAAKAIVLIDPKARYAIPELLDLLKDKNGDVRVAGIWALWFMGPPVNNQEKDIILQALDDNNKTVGYYAKLIMYSISGEAGVKNLLNFICTSNKIGEKVEAIDTLGSMGAVAERALPALQELATSDSDPFIKQAAIRAVKSIKSEI